MVTLRIRDVPDEVVEVLRWCATDAGMSLSAYLRQEFSRLARQPAKVNAAAVREALERHSY